MLLSKGLKFGTRRKKFWGFRFAEGQVLKVVQDEGAGSIGMDWKDWAQEQDGKSIKRRIRKGRYKLKERGSRLVGFWKIVVYLLQGLRA